MPSPTPEQEAAFQDWYKGTIQTNPDRFDPSHFTEGQAREWERHWDPAGRKGAGGFRSSKKYASGEAVEGSDYDHPDECPPGFAAFGADQCRPTGGAGGPGGGGGAGGPGLDGGPAGGGALDWATIQKMMGGFAPNLGDDFGMGKYWQSILGGGKAATEALAPQMGGIVKDTEAAKARILRSVPPGGQRDKLLAQLEASKATAGQGARLGLIPQAQAGLSGLYGQQLGARTAQLGQGLGAYTQGMGFDTQRDIAGMDDATRRMLGMGQLDLGWGQLGEQGRQFDLGLGWDQDKFGQGLGWEKESFGKSFGEGQRQFDLSRRDQRAASKRSFWSSIFGGVGSILGGSKLLSDMRLKENVESYTPGLSEIVKLNPIEYDYKDDDKTHAVSFSAQEVEKVIPDAVTKKKVGPIKDMRFIDLAKILAATVNAVKELDERTKK